MAFGNHRPDGPTPEELDLAATAKHYVGDLLRQIRTCLDRGSTFPEEKAALLQDAARLLAPGRKELPDGRVKTWDAELTGTAADQLLALVAALEKL